MDGYNLVNVNELVKQVGEDTAKRILSNFSCPLNPDVEDFIKHKAIEFDKQGISKTHLVVCQHKGQAVIIGYFTLANKALVVTQKSLSNNLAKRIRKFATRNDDNNFVIQAPLIGQLGKNFHDHYDALISGAELLEITLNVVREAQSLLGGKIVYLECEDHEKLTEFYCNHGFCNFGKRKLDGDERASSESDYYIQMLRYLDT